MVRVPVTAYPLHAYTFCLLFQVCLSVLVCLPRYQEALLEATHMAASLTLPLQIAGGQH